MAKTLLSIVSEIANLKSAWEAIKSGKSEDKRKNSKGIDEESIADFADGYMEKLRKLSKELQDETYHAQELLAFKDKKKSKGYRLISVPTVRDRIVQAAILLAIKEHFPKIRNGSSFCLPKTSKKSEKRSFIDAFEKLKNQVLLGNSYVFESDIQSFFDKVDKKCLLERITVKLPDQSIDHLLREVVYFKIGNLNEFESYIQQGLIGRPEAEKGLCQGSPLSPLFANVYLEAFDASMISLYPHTYIRYVDDFIVLCKSAKETDVAHRLTIELLTKEGLTLPPLSNDAEKSKTRTRISLAEGDKFDFLGVVVCRESIQHSGTLHEVINELDSKCYTVGKLRRYLKHKKKDCSSKALCVTINNRVQGRFGSYGYFHDEEKIAGVNEYILKKNRESGLDIKLIKFPKKVKQIIIKSAWQAYFNQV